MITSRRCRPNRGRCSPPNRVVRRLDLVVVVLCTGLGGCSASTTNARVIQKSMEPTIRSGEYIRIDMHAYERRDPQVGDIVSLRAPANAVSERCAMKRRREQPCRRSALPLANEYLKRIIAGPGQRVSINKTGRARPDGVLQKEPFIISCRLFDLCRLARPTRIERAHYFVLGDNRPYSSDSRTWGPVPRNRSKAR